MCDFVLNRKLPANYQCGGPYFGRSPVGAKPMELLTYLSYAESVPWAGRDRFHAPLSRAPDSTANSLDVASGFYAMSG